MGSIDQRSNIIIQLESFKIKDGRIVGIKKKKKRKRERKKIGEKRAY